MANAHSLNSPQLILAVGAAGPYAGLVVPELARRGVRVRGLVHDPADVPKARAAGAVEIVVGDLARLADVERALADVAAVFYLAPAFMPNEAAIGVAFVQAAVAAGVRRIVFSSVIHPQLSALVNHRDKAPVEDAILSSGMEYTILQPGLFFQNFARAWPQVAQTGVFAEPWSSETRLSRVDYRDVAEAAAIALTEDRLLYGTFELCTQETSTRHELAALMTQVLGRPVRAERVDPARAIPDPASPVRHMMEWYDQHHLLGNGLTLQAVLGHPPRTLRAYLEELMEALPRDSAPGLRTGSNQGAPDRVGVR